MGDMSFKAGYSDGDVDTNSTGNLHLNEIISDRFSRRQTMLGGMKASAAAFFGTSLLAACSDDELAGLAPSPVAQAGATTTATAGQMVTLAAIDGQWTQSRGPQVELIERDGAIGFIAPAVSEATPIEFTISGGGANSAGANSITKVNVGPAKLTFAAVAKNQNDLVTVPAGYSVKVMTALGDPLAAGFPAYANDGSDTDFANRIGDHGDALYYYGLGPNNRRNDNFSKRGLLVQNHENLNVQYLHPNGPTNVSTGPRPAAEAIKEIEAHGVSITEYRDTGDRDWEWVQGSPFNRRITPNTPVVFNGPVAGSDYLKTVFSPDGRRGRGTINNCANGHTGWGTNLTCEENWAFYFRRSGDDAARTTRELTGLNRYGVRGGIGNYAWSTVPESEDPSQIFRRWDARADANRTALEDYRNEPNQFGWVVEIDPYDPSATPRKRTALGRMGHEGAWLGPLRNNQKVAIYMGDDARREYFYKFVSDATWDPRDGNRSDHLAVGDKYLDAGTLYVARFNSDGTGDWLPLVFGSVPARPAVGSTPAYEFEDQVDILVHSRLAADAVGATPMDRPEWTGTNPQTGEIYLTLTNNNASNRPLDGTDAANPRHYSDPRNGNPNFGNPNGHIIRIREGGDNTAATRFLWDIYLFGADSADASSDVNLSGLGPENDFSSPDGLWFSRPQNPAGNIRPLLWIQTDDGAFTDRTNNQMLAGLPGFVGDGESRTITNVGAGGATAIQSTHVGNQASTATLKRFLTGPDQCEITGVDTTPDGRTLFVGIQHPGEDGSPSDFGSNWPASQTGGTGRPRSAVVAITKDDGGVVGL
ncbi:PhoX family protein [Aurantiacibacter odishensis]|uniref:PhoX family protein n=1 Tax=Aurantiacibacter odishensis TaxID=1155476 RepID=UPI000E760FB0|nr:PhoX family phosphatase [Aurantiacibacter odishensis]